MRVLDLFSGIGGFSLGLERAGMETVAFCEIDPFCQRVLRKHWPDVPIYEDVSKLSNEILKNNGVDGVDLITSGFPCQDISVAGNKAGIGAGTRSGLYVETVRLCGEILPRHILLENVTALLTLDGGAAMRTILGDFQRIGYDAWWEIIPARAVGMPHERGRVWIYLYPNGCDAAGIRESVRQNLVTKKRKTKKTKQEWVGWLNELVTRNIALRANSYASALRILDGIPRRVDRLKSLGNAVVPQIPEIIGRAIMESEA